MARFDYTLYIRTHQQALWNALTDREFVRQYWYGMHLECDWKVGSPWRLSFPDGRVADLGEVLEIEAPHRLVLRWRNEFMPELKAEGDSICSMSLEPVAGAVKLTIVHSIERNPAAFITAVSSGWPRILSNLKSLLETGQLALVEATQA